MKSINKILFIYIFSICSITSLDAAKVTWLGGNASWSNPSQWDTGAVPTMGDDVIIPSGHCKIFSGNSEIARTVEVQSSAKLTIRSGAALKITEASDDDGLHNMGKVYIYGSLEIDEIAQSSSLHSANAIKNEKTIYTYPNSHIVINNIDDVAINNSTSISLFSAKGTILVYAVNSTAIANADRFHNYGTIDIENSGSGSGFLIMNSDQFRNYGSGTINLKSEIYGGFSNSQATSLLQNFGNMYIDDVSIGINNSGQITNYSGATIDFGYNDISLYNRQDGIIDNSGLIHADYSGSGISNYGLFTNHDYFKVYNSAGIGSIHNHETGIIDNYYSMYLSGDGYYDIENKGEITNHNGAYFTVVDHIRIETSGVFTNNGFLNSFAESTHQISGTLTNNGVVDDRFASLQGVITNNKVIVAPITGPMQNGIPYPNVLDVASLTDVSILNWKVSPNGAIAGTYNESTNEFTPNALAIGLKTIYVSIQDDITGNNRTIPLIMDSAVLPFTSQRKLASTRKESAKETDDELKAELNIYPNPSSGSVQLESAIFENSPTHLHIFNAMGQLVHQKALNIGLNTRSLELPNHLANGMYFVKIIQKGIEVDLKRIQLYR